MKFAILSDIHANLTALETVFDYIDNKYINEEVRLIILGDLINYGPRPNETIDLIKKRDPFALILGNHEQSFKTGEVTRFSSKRGIESLKFTATILNSHSKDFIALYNRGTLELEIANRKVLLVHGDLTDVFWGKMNKEEMEKKIYARFDFVLSGHTHIPHFVEIFYFSNRPLYRNKRKTIFINPGSVGQPRNHNNCAQFCITDFSTECICFKKIIYNIGKETSYFSNNIDSFYKKRLEAGI